MCARQVWSKATAGVGAVGREQGGDSTCIPYLGGLRTCTHRDPGACFEALQQVSGDKELTMAPVTPNGAVSGRFGPLEWALTPHTCWADCDHIQE